MTPTGRRGPCRAMTMCPGTSFKCNWRSTTRPSCCGASRATRNWVRTVSADEIANVFTRHLGFASGTAAGKRPLVEPGGDRPDGGPVAPAPGLAGSVATGGFPASRKAPAAHAGAGLRLLASAGALGLRRPGTALRTPRSNSTAPRPSTSSGTEGPAPAATASPRRWDGYPIPSSSPSSPLPGIPGNGRRNTPTTCKRYGRNWMDRLSTRLRTWFPNAPWARSWPPAKDGGATINPAPAPVGYLVNHASGLSGFHGVGYDYVLGSGGLYVQSESAHLTARVRIAPCEVRGLASVSEKLVFTHGPIPSHVFELGWAGCWPGRTPSGSSRCAGTGTSTGWWCRPRRGRVRPSPTSRPAALSPSFTPTPTHRAFFSATDDRDEQGFRVYGVVGRLDTPCARIDPASRHLRPLRAAVLVPGLRQLIARPPAGRTKNRNQPNRLPIHIRR